MTKTPPIKSKDVKVPRWLAEEILKKLHKIGGMSKATHLTDSADGYAYSLGACNGIAKSIITELEVLGVDLPSYDRTISPETMQALGVEVS
jgi:hypothetical protein